MKWSCRSQAPSSGSESEGKGHLNRERECGPLYRQGEGALTREAGRGGFTHLATLKPIHPQNQTCEEGKGRERRKDETLISLFLLVLLGTGFRVLNVLGKNALPLRQSHNVAQARLILLPWPPGCWDYRSHR